MVVLTWLCPSSRCQTLARNAWLALFFVQIEIAIGIEIGITNILTVCQSPPDLSNLVAPPIQTAEHHRHALEFRLTALALGLPQIVSKCHFFSILITIPIWIWSAPTVMVGGWRASAKEKAALRRKGPVRRLFLSVCFPLHWTPLLRSGFN